MIITIPGILQIIAVVGLLSILGAIAFFIYHVLKREREFQEKEHATFTQYQEIIKKANSQAVEILDKAMATSAHILGETKTTNEAVTQDFNQALQKLTQAEVVGLANEAGMLKTTLDKNTLQMVQEAEKNLSQQLTIFAQTMLARATKSEEMLSTKTKEMLEEIESQMADYKRTKMEKVDATILELIKKTYQDIIGKSIPPNIHQDLILEALEKTKKEGIFDL